MKTISDWEKAVADFYGVRDAEAALRQAVAAIKREVLSDPELRSCRTFSELHDFCDANCLGGFCHEAFPFGDDYDDSYRDAMHRFVSAAQDSVHEWLVKRASEGGY